MAKKLRRKTRRKASVKGAPRKAAAAREAGIGETAVRARTGRGWAQWFRILDRAGARTLGHTRIAALLDERHPEIGGWWAQMVTVAYEQARGLRAKHQRPDGFQVGASRTLAVPLSELYAAWSIPARRARWLKPPITVRKAKRGKSMRITWRDGTSVDVQFHAKGRAKALVAVQHGKLASAADGERMKAFWSRALDDLRTRLEA